MLLLLLLFGPARAACPDLVTTLDAAEHAYTSMDVDAFRVAADEAREAAACLDRRLDAPVLARLHRVQGLSAFFLGHDPTKAAEAFAAARALEPGYVFPESLVPAGHPVLQAWVAASPSPGPTVALPLPASGHIEIDGRTTNARPIDRPALFQLVDGTVVASGYSWPSEALPPYTKMVPSHRRGPNMALTIVSGVSIAAAGACVFLARDSYTRFYDADTPTADLPGLRNGANGWTYGSIGAGVLALGAGAGAVIAGRW